MSVLQCLACQHESPPTAKFCSECGGQLNLMLCRQCDAINERAWQRCYNCGVEFPVKSKSAPRRMRTSRIIVSLLAFAPMAGLAFYLYTQPKLNGDEVHVGKLPAASDSRLEASAAAVDASTAKTRASVVAVSTSQQRLKRANHNAEPAKAKKSAAVAAGHSPAGTSAAAGDTSSAKPPKPLTADPTVGASAQPALPNDFHFIAPPP